MSGTSRTSQNSSTQTEPWGPAKPALQGILSGINSQIGNYQPTGTEQQALQQLTTNSQNLPNFGPQATSLAQGYLGGDPTGLLNPALAQYQQRLGPIADQNNDPMQTPGMRALLDTIKNDVGGSINSQFAGAGRDLSGLNTQTLARGLSQGLAAPLLAQYNQNVGAQGAAASNLYQAAGDTANAIGGNQQQGLGFANAIPALQNASAMGVLNAQGAARGLPLQNLGMLANLTVPIAGLGGTSNTQSQGSYTMSPWQQATQAASMFGGQYSPVSGMASAAQGVGKGLSGLLSMFG